MIVDVHVHVFPSLKETAGYSDVQSNYAVHQGKIRRLWARMKTNTLDERYIPDPNEDVGFRMDDYGKFHWTKHGKECWMQRFPAVLKNMEWTPEQMVAFMDEVGVDKGIIQSGYMEMNFERDYIAEVTGKWPDRFIGTVTLDYDVEKGSEHLKGEIEKLRRAAANPAVKGVYQVFPRGQAIEGSDFDPLWRELSDLGLPHFFFVGFQPKDNYLYLLKQIETVLTKFPDLIGIIGHLGGNIRPLSHCDYTDGKELLPVLRLPNAYFEVGYVLAYENWALWKENYEYPYPLHTKLIKMLYDDVGCERLLWGSDMPNLYRTCTYRQCLDLVRLHFDFLGDDEKDLILGGNAARIFCLKS